VLTVEPPPRIVIRWQGKRHEYVRNFVGGTGYHRGMTVRRFLVAAARAISSSVAAA
jgi:hypothetical protein